MQPIFFIAAISFIFLLFLYTLIRKHQQNRQFTHKLQTSESALHTLQAAHHALQQELSGMQNQIRQSSEDPITHLLGWQLFEDRLTQSIKESQRYQLSMGILFVDIDDFKVINDALSYEVGDALLFEVAQRLKTCIRQVDSISRFTKDTFVVLLTQLSKPEAAAVVAQRMLQILAQPFLIQEHELYITACVGIATYPADGQNTQTLLRSGDHALHLAKEKGTHLYQFYQERMHVRSQRELALYTSLSRESILTELVLYYQPVMNVEEETIFCMDALLHWQHSEFGLIKPQELFSLMEKQRKTNVIFEWLLRSACTQFLKWRSSGLNTALLGIPISVRELENSHFVYRLQQILQELQYKPEWILLEVREGQEASSFETMEKAFNMLKYLGVKIAIDHFGLGHFSLSHLKNFAIHYLKLDSSLIENIYPDGSQQTLALIKGLVFLAHSMSMRVIIQGVESEQQMTILKGLGCSLMQGQFLGGPLSEREVTSKITVTRV